MQHLNLALSLLAGVSALRNASSEALVRKERDAPTFRAWYDSHKSGRGIWKWDNAVNAYQRHLSPMAGKELNVAEVGVQSGGSMLMWHACLGDKIHTYGMDINKNCMAFDNEKTTIVLGDQSSTAMWQHFFDKIVPELDVFVDDGSHLAPHMVTTLQQTLPHMSAGGILAMEDIHGEHYLQSFFLPAASMLGERAAAGKLSAVHMYPYLLLSQEAGGKVLSFEGQKQTEVKDLAELDKMAHEKRGELLIVKRDFFNTDGMKLVFSHFISMHHADWHDEPAGCAHTSAAVCEVIVHNNEMQNLISGVHVFKDRLVVEVTKENPKIFADRKGTEWISYE